MLPLTEEKIMYEYEIKVPLTETDYADMYDTDLVQNPEELMFAVKTFYTKSWAYKKANELKNKYSKVCVNTIYRDQDFDSGEMQINTINSEVIYENL